MVGTGCPPYGLVGDFIPAVTHGGLRLFPGRTGGAAVAAFPVGAQIGLDVVPLAALVARVVAHLGAVAVGRRVVVVVTAGGAVVRREVVAVVGVVIQRRRAQLL